MYCIDIVLFVVVVHERKCKLSSCNTETIHLQNTPKPLLKLFGVGIQYFTLYNNLWDMGYDSGQNRKKHVIDETKNTHCVGFH